MKLSLLGKSVDGQEIATGKDFVIHLSKDEFLQDWIKNQTKFRAVVKTQIGKRFYANLA